jgi:hypothetical protein
MGIGPRLGLEMGRVVMESLIGPFYLSTLRVGNFRSPTLLVNGTGEKIDMRDDRSQGTSTWAICCAGKAARTR